MAVHVPVIIECRRFARDLYHAPEISTGYSYKERICAIRIILTRINKSMKLLV